MSKSISGSGNIRGKGMRTREQGACRELRADQCGHRAAREAEGASDSPALGVPKVRGIRSIASVSSVPTTAPLTVLMNEQVDW